MSQSKALVLLVLAFFGPSGETLAAPVPTSPPARDPTLRWDVVDTAGAGCSADAPCVVGSETLLVRKSGGGLRIVGTHKLGRRDSDLMTLVRRGSGALREYRATQSGQVVLLTRVLAGESLPRYMTEPGMTEPPVAERAVTLGNGPGYGGKTSDPITSDPGTRHLWTTGARHHLSLLVGPLVAHRSGDSPSHVALEWVLPVARHQGALVLPSGTATATHRTKTRVTDPAGTVLDAELWVLDGTPEKGPIELLLAGDALIATRGAGLETRLAKWQVRWPD